MPRLYFSIACALVVLFSAGVAGAQKFDVMALVDMPKIPVLLQSYFESRTDIHSETPEGDESLSYTVRLPKEWTKSTDAGLRNYVLNTNVVGEVARYFGPPDGDKRSMFTVNALQLEYEISIRNWFVNHVLTNGYTLQGFQQLSETKIEALYVLVEKEQSFVVRSVAELNGRRVVLAEYAVPYDLWHQEKSMQQASIRSFMLLKPDQSVIEILDTYNFLDLIEFQYPISWSLRAPAIRSIDQMGVTLVNAAKSGQMDGFIDVGVMSTDIIGMDPQEQAEKLSRKMMQGLKARTGFEIGEKIEDITDYKVNPVMKSAMVRTFVAKDETQSLVGYEIWIAVMREADYKYYITMVTPARKDEFYTWARNSKAFQRVVESIHSGTSDIEPDYTRYNDYREKQKKKDEEKNRIREKNPFFRE